MISGLKTGNAHTDGVRFNDWFIGDIKRWCLKQGQPYEASQFGHRDTSAVEVKWGVHPAGQLRPNGWAAGGDKITLSILIRGEFSLQFRCSEYPSKVQEVYLLHEGDYAIWGVEVEHTWQSLRESVMLTVRWPAC